ncbi:hypothetical protein BCV72DRAFT_262825 [Rhizopus microsporus var. microsporus]|uniref:Uncharacterized protein n=1 Tax=Rhizopus microsporus var. microsporus TaxID=86635 RepID=A0A1X0R2Q0_RHIZD|nr:hypothetical protein BCV72DRAFT_262825 [Rhizopus microsporus var. microsporus]
MDRIRKEVEYCRTKSSGQQRNTCDSCACIVNFKAPCFHILSQYNIISLSEVSRRWWINHDEECIEIVQEDDEKINEKEDEDIDKEENEEKEKGDEFEEIEDTPEETDTAACKEENDVAQPVDDQAENAQLILDLHVYINDALTDIQTITMTMFCQQHLIDALKELTDLKEKLLGPKYKLENILPPPTNANNKGRKPNTKKLVIALEIYEEDKKKREAKRMKIEKEEQRRKEIRKIRI